MTGSSDRRAAPPIARPDRPLRVLMIVPFAESMGGLELQARQLARALSARGARVDLLTCGYARDGSPSTRALREGPRLAGVAGDFRRVTTLPLPWRRSRGNGAMFAAMGALLLLARRRFYDVWHAHGVAGPIAGAARALAPRGNTPIAVWKVAGEVDLDLIEASPLAGMARAALARLDATVVMTDTLGGRVRRALAGRAARLRVIPNAVELERFRPARDAGDRLALRRELGLPWDRVVLYVGRIEAAKGVDCLLHAFRSAAAQEPGCGLALLGRPYDPAFLVSLERGVAEAGLAERVRFAGTVSDVAPWLRAADAFVLPSRSEGMPNALLEALAAGVPAVVSDIPATRETLCSGDGGEPIALLVPPGDDVALATGLLRALRERDLVAAMAARGRALVHARYALDTIAESWLDLYREIMAARDLEAAR